MPKALYDIDALVEILAAHDAPYLTSQEVVVLQFVAEGWSYREIAERLGVSKRAVPTTIYELKMRFAVRTRPELIRLCQRLDLLSQSSAAPDSSTTTTPAAERKPPDPDVGTPS